MATLQFDTKKNTLAVTDAENEFWVLQTDLKGLSLSKYSGFGNEEDIKVFSPHILRINDITNIHIQTNGVYDKEKTVQIIVEPNIKNHVDFEIIFDRIGQVKKLPFRENYLSDNFSISGDTITCLTCDDFTEVIDIDDSSSLTVSLNRSGLPRHIYVTDKFTPISGDTMFHNITYMGIKDDNQINMFCY